MKPKSVILRGIRRKSYDFLLRKFIEKAKSMSVDELSKKIDRQDKWINDVVYEQSKSLSRRDIEALCRKLEISVCDHKVKEQKLFLYCDCGNELISSDSFFSDMYDKDWNNHVIFKCSKCGKELDFNFDVPVPVRWPDDGKSYLEEYKKVIDKEK
jgi:hypothetical protein